MKAFEFNLVFNFNVNKVFEAWSRPDYLKQWWGPPEYSVFIKAFDFQEKGIFHYSISSMEGFPLWGRFTFGEIIPNQKIEFINSFSDENGNIVRAPFSDTWPLEIHNQAYFTGNEMFTRFLLKANPLHASPEEIETYMENLENLKTGFGGTLNQLNQFLEKSQ